MAISANLDSILDGNTVAVPVANPTGTNDEPLLTATTTTTAFSELDDALALQNLVNFGHDGIKWDLFTDWSIVDMEG